MTIPLEFPEQLRLIDEGMVAFRAAIAAAPDLDAPVPTCPGWTLVDLVQHLDNGRRRWAATVAAGPADSYPDPSVWAGPTPVPRDREGLLARLADSAELLRAALLEAGPDRGCWSWWHRSVTPQTSGAVARHQVQEVAVHTYDALVAQGSPRPLTTEVALDGVDEFLFTCCAGAYSWPYPPVAVDYFASEGPSWRVSLAADGVRVSRPDTTDADASLYATASELVLVMYGRIPAESLKVAGDGGLFQRLLDWDPDA